MHERPPSIEDVKTRLPIPDAWRLLGLEGEPGRCCRSPFPHDHKHADRTPSFSIYEDGRKWKNHTTDEGGDVLDFIVKARRCTPAEALAWAREQIGWTGAGHGPALARKAAPKPRPVVPAAPRYVPQEMTGDALALWEEGAHMLTLDRAAQDRIDTWRGWGSGVAGFLADQGLLATPCIGGRRGVAFLVQYPLRSSWVAVGFHFRHFPRDTDKVPWSFHPRGVPSVPFLLGNFHGARLAIVMEGQWDAACFAAAAGWLASDSAWPDGVAVLGVRGASGWRAFIEHWKPRWPRHCRFLLLPDGDEAGLRWRTEFAAALAPLALSVAVLPPAPGGPKDFNDMHRAKPFTPADIARLLHAQGLISEKGVPL